MGLLKSDSTSLPASTHPTTMGGGFNAILDRGSEFDGKLTFEGTVRIDGKFKGEIISDANLVIGEAGKVEADIKIGSISISGEVVGNITARGKVELHAPAVVKGNIHTPSLVIEDGVTFEGSCQMDKSMGQKFQKGANVTPLGGVKKEGGEARS
jgi:cytoskeletal protein CcmA (bactofilin family)